MNKITLTNISLTLILAFGLFSCSKEKAGPVMDSFHVDTPVVLARFKVQSGPGLTEPLKMNLDSKMKETLYPSSVVEIEALKNNDFVTNPISLNVIGNCQTGSAIYNLRKIFSNIKSFQLISLFDFNMVVENSRSNLTSTCSMNFEFINKNGSTEVFRFKDIPIGPLMKEDVANINLVSHDEQGAEFDSRLPIVGENRNAGVKYPLTTQTQIILNSPAEPQLMLVCENFISQLSSKKQTYYALSQFDSARLIKFKNLSSSFGETDPRIAIPAQDCRIMTESAGPDYQLKYSRQFRLVTKSPELKVKLKSNTKLFTNISKTGAIQAGSSPEIFHIEVFNPTNSPMTIAFGQMKMQVLASRNPGQKEYREGFTQDMSIQIEGGQFIGQDPVLGKVITISAMAHLNVSYLLPFANTCRIIQIDATNFVPLPNYEEIWAHNLSNLSIIQLANPVIDNLTFHPEYYKVFYQTEEGAIPGASWTTEIGSGLNCENFHSQ